MVGLYFILTYDILAITSSQLLELAVKKEMEMMMQS
jgi:hypothetical protein